MPNRSLKGDTLKPGATFAGIKNSGSNGRKLATTDEPPPSIGFMSWKEYGQKVCGVVEKVGQKIWDAGDDPSPDLTLLLTEPTYTFRKGVRVDLPAGARMVVTASQDDLKPRIEALDPVPGLYLEITYTHEVGMKKKFNVDYDPDTVGPNAHKPVKFGDFDRADDSPPPF